MQTHHLAIFSLVFLSYLQAGSDALEIDSSGNSTLNGDLNVAGNLTAAKDLSASNLSVTNVTATGTMTANGLSSSGDISATGNITTAGTISGLGIVPIGSVIPFAGTKTSVPSGWMLCDGTAVSRTTYAALHGTISDLYGRLTSSRRI